MADASRNFPKWRWTEGRERAAALVAEDAVSDEQIAADLGVTRRTLTTWKQHPEFAARVDEHLAAFRRRVLRKGFALRERRIDALNGIATDLLAQLRADDYLADEVKLANNGQEVRYPVFDKPKVGEFRAALDDIAKELGERKANVEVGAAESFIAAMMEYGRGARG